MHKLCVGLTLGTHLMEAHRMNIDLSPELVSKLQELAAQVGIEPEELITKAVEQLTSMDAEGVLALLSGDKTEMASGLIDKAKSFFN